MKKKVFYSFHFDNDVFRVQQIRNIGVIDGNEPVKPNEWETIKRSGNKAIENWIDENIKRKDIVVVLVGEETHERPWVDYEIRKAWELGKPVMGIYIHNINCMKNGVCRKGQNPFEKYNIRGTNFSRIVKCHDPGTDAYNDIKNNLERWIDEAAIIRAKY